MKLSKLALTGTLSYAPLKLGSRTRYLELATAWHSVRDSCNDASETSARNRWGNKILHALHIKQPQDNAVTGCCCSHSLWSSLSCRIVSGSAAARYVYPRDDLVAGQEGVKKYLKNHRTCGCYAGQCDLLLAVRQPAQDAQQCLSAC